MITPTPDRIEQDFRRDTRRNRTGLLLTMAALVVWTGVLYAATRPPDPAPHAPRLVIETDQPLGWKTVIFRESKPPATGMTVLSGSTTEEERPGPPPNTRTTWITGGSLRIHKSPGPDEDFDMEAGHRCWEFADEFLFEQLVWVPDDDE